MVVLLPAPLGPSNPAISPRRTLKEMSEIAVRPAKCFDRFSTSIMKSDIGPGCRRWVSPKWSHCCQRHNQHFRRKGMGGAIKNCQNERSAAGPAAASYDGQRAVEPSAPRLVLGRCCGWA